MSDLSRAGGRCAALHRKDKQSVTIVTMFTPMPIRRQTTGNLPHDG
jgi:hypothetical protein